MAHLLMGRDVGRVVHRSFRGIESTLFYPANFTAPYLWNVQFYRLHFAILVALDTGTHPPAFSPLTLFVHNFSHTQDYSGQAAASGVGTGKDATSTR